MTPYRLIALDLDGTLIGDDIQVSPRAASAIHRILARGIHVTLASGRSFPSMCPFAELLGVRDPLICYQGGRICVPPHGRVLYDRALPLDATRDLLRFALAEDLDITVYLEDHVYLRDLRRPQRFYDRYFGLPMSTVDDLLAVLTRPPTKAIIIGEEADNDRLIPELESRFVGRLAIVRSHRYFVEAVPLGVTKGAALAWLANYLGVRREETLAIGDGGNDSAMVAWANMGIAMGNAMPGVKAVADWVAPTLGEDGVAVALERFVLDSSE